MRGFSLAEVSLGVAIAATMAGIAATGASYVDNKAKVNAMTAKAEELVTAIDAYMSNARGIDYPLHMTPSNLDGGGTPGVDTVFTTALKPFLKSGTDEYTNPFANATWHVSYDYLRMGGDGNYYTYYFIDTNPPPWSSSTYRGIYYHSRQNGVSETAFPTFRAWTGPTTYNTYKYWTLMVVDEKGYPKAVWGR